MLGCRSGRSGAGATGCAMKGRRGCAIRRIGKPLSRWRSAHGLDPWAAEEILRMADALDDQKDDAADLVKLFALLGRIRLVAPPTILTAAERTFDTIVETYLGPNRSMHEVLDDVRRGGFNFLTEFGEACRQELARD
jgi:hypothetical protein